MRARPALLLCALVLPALLLRAAIPAGFMPGAGGLRICNGGLSRAGPHHHSHGAPAHGTGCLFGGSAAGLAPGPPAGAPASLHAAAAPRLVPATAVRVAGPLRRAHAPRAPPARV